MTENDNVAAGLLELIADHKITTLIIVGISKSWYVFLLAAEAFSTCCGYFVRHLHVHHRVNRSKRNLAAALQKGTDPTCNILFMHKGSLISIRYQWVDFK